jgi:hypothetical protein
MADYFTSMVAHIAQLSKTPGWGAYARQWAKELEADRSGAFEGLIEAVREHLKSSADQPKSGEFKP